MRDVICYFSFISFFYLGFLFADDVLPAAVAKVGQVNITKEEYVVALVRADGESILNTMITEKVIELELAANQLPAVTEEQVDVHIALIEKQLKNTQGPYANIQTFIENQNLKMLDFRGKIKREIGIRRILGKKIEITEQEALAQYEKMKNIYMRPEGRRVIGISVFDRNSPVPKTMQTDRTSDEAKELAGHIRKAWSENPDYVKTLWDTKQHYIRGYDDVFMIPIGLKSNKEFAPLFNLPLGAVSEVIKDKNGYNIYKVIEDLKPRLTPFPEVKETIINELISERITKSINDGEFEKIKQKYNVQTFINFKDVK